MEEKRAIRKKLTLQRKEEKARWRTQLLEDFRWRYQMTPMQRAVETMQKRRRREAETKHRRDLERIGAGRPRRKWYETGPEGYERKLKIESRYRPPAPIKPLTEAQRGRADINFTIAQDIVNKYPNREDESAANLAAIGRATEITKGKGSPKAVQRLLKDYYDTIEEPDELTEAQRKRADVNFAFANRIYKKFPAKEQRAEALQEALTKAPLVTQQGGHPDAVYDLVKGFYSGSFVEDLITGIEGIVEKQEKRRGALR